MALVLSGYRLVSVVTKVTTSFFSSNGESVQVMVAPHFFILRLARSLAINSS